jgi:hypothetical protein
MTTQHADWNDILASVIGSSLAAFFIFLRSKSQKGMERKRESAFKKDLT